MSSARPPVTQLEQGPLLDGELAQRLEQPAVLLVARDHRQRCEARGFAVAPTRGRLT